jgi:hypothetical protein
MNFRIKIFVISLSILLFNLPLFVFANDLTLVQVVESGELSFVQMPTDIVFPAVEILDKQIENFAIPEFVNLDEVNHEGLLELSGISDASLEQVTQGIEQKIDKIVVADLRYSGGFRLEMAVSPMENESDVGEISIDKIGFLLFRDESEFRNLEKLKGNAKPVFSDFLGDPKESEQYKSVVSEAGLVIVDGSVADADSGRLGRYEFFPAFKLKLSPDLPEGKYVGEVVYTLVSE